MSKKEKRSGKEESLGWIGELDRIEMRFLADFRRRMKAAGLQNRDLERRLRINSSTSSMFLLGRRGLTFRGAYKYCKALGLDFIPYPGVVCRQSDGVCPVLPRNVSRARVRQIEGLKRARRRARHKKQRSYTYEIKYFRGLASFDPVAYYLQRVVTQLKKQGVKKSELARRLEVKHPYVIKMLSGKVNISFGAAVKLAEALGCTFDPVLRDKNGVRYSPCDDPVEESS